MHCFIIDIVITQREIDQREVTRMCSGYESHVRIYHASYLQFVCGFFPSDIQSTYMRCEAFDADAIYLLPDTSFSY